jgi:GT2 family glycosyltransferase
MSRVLACITTREGNPPLLLKEMLETACRAAADAGHAAFLSIPEDRYSVAACRNRAVNDLLKSDCSHILFVDDDVYVPPQTIVELLKMERQVAAGVYPSIKKQYPADLKAETYIVAGKNGAWYRKWFSGVRNVDVVGAGCLMIRKDVFNVVKFPWFRWPEGVVDGQHIVKSDDLDFCERCKANGIEVWANGDVRCGHVKAVDISNFIEA